MKETDTNNKNPMSNLIVWLLKKYVKLENFDAAYAELALKSEIIPMEHKMKIKIFKFFILSVIFMLAQ